MSYNHETHMMLWAKARIIAPDSTWMTMTPDGEVIPDETTSWGEYIKLIGVFPVYVLRVGDGTACYSDKAFNYKEHYHADGTPIP